MRGKPHATKNELAAPLLLLFLLVESPAWAGDFEEDRESAPLPSAQLIQDAEGHYYDAEFERAMALCNLFLDRDDLTLDERAKGILLQAYIYSAQSMSAQTKDKIEEAWRVKRELAVDPDVVPPRFMRDYYDVMNEIEQNRVTNTIAVLPFTNNCIDERERLEPLAKGVADIFQTHMTRVSDMRIVERERYAYIGDENGLQQSEQIDPNTAVRLGKQLGVHYLLTGSYMVLGDRVRLTCRVISTETTELILADMKDGKAGELLELIDGLARNTAQKVGETTQKVEVDNINFDSILHYSEGLALMDAADYPAAYRKFNEALREEPEFEKARKRIRQLAPVVASAEGGR